MTVALSFIRDRVHCLQSVTLRIAFQVFFVIVDTKASGCTVEAHFLALIQAINIINREWILTPNTWLYFPALWKQHNTTRVVYRYVYKRYKRPWNKPRNAKVGQKACGLRQVTYFYKFGTPFISLERTELETSNLVCRLIVGPTSQKMQN